MLDDGLYNGGEGEVSSESRSERLFGLKSQGRDKDCWWLQVTITLNNTQQNTLKRCLFLRIYTYSTLLQAP